MRPSTTFLLWSTLAAVLYFLFVAYMPVESIAGALLYAGSALAFSGAVVLWIHVMERRPPEEVGT